MFRECTFGRRGEWDVVVAASKPGVWNGGEDEARTAAALGVCASAIAPLERVCVHRREMHPVLSFAKYMLQWSRQVRARHESHS